MWTAKFNLEDELQTNDVIESDVKEVKASRWLKAQMTQIIGLIGPVLLYFYDTTNVALMFSCIKLLLTLVEFKWEKVIILWLRLTPRAWRVVLVWPHSISVSTIVNYTNMVATSHVKLGTLKSKVNFCLIWALFWRQK